ncbi:hypothetical protein KAS56_07645, partial [candidate division WOR-3 bacterium]|nr:hypothetical protein [candidate division WOR-3 bacterium]
MSTTDKTLKFTFMVKIDDPWPAKIEIKDEVRIKGELKLQVLIKNTAYDFILVECQVENIAIVSSL